MPPPPSKRRKTESKTEEITFNLSARQEFLTGFHKRKVQRAKHAQEVAEKRAREERIAERKRIRDERKADLERHVQEINALIRPEEDESEEEEQTAKDWNGVEDVAPPPIDHEAEYVDEDKYTTVTVEALDASRDGLAKLGRDSDDSAEDESTVKTDYKKEAKKPVKVKSAAAKKRSEESKLKKRKKKSFRYESKTDRKISRTKEKLKNSKQARERKAG